MSQLVLRSVILVKWYAILAGSEENPWKPRLFPSAISTPTKRIILHLLRNLVVSLQSLRKGVFCLPKAAGARSIATECEGGA
jgi:hypothetical protein